MLNPKDLWREVAKLHQAKGRSRTDALKLVIVEWLLKGDTEPLTEAIAEGELDDPVLSVIALMLQRDEALDYFLAVEPLRLGAPKKAGRQWRDAFMAMFHEQLCRKLGSEGAFEVAADHFGLSVSAVRTAVTNYRKLCKRQVVDLPTTKKS